MGIKPRQGNWSVQEKRDFARQMRLNSTQAEKALWWKLSRNQFGLRFQRQAMICGYIVDFYCARLRLIVEVDGSVHELENVAADDEQRERVLENHGFLVLRFSNDDVLDHLTVVLVRLWDECSARRIALKALPMGYKGKSVQDARLYSRSCASVEKSHNPTPVEKTTVDATPKVPATAEDFADLNRAWRNLVVCSRQRSLAFNHATLTTAAEVALDQQLRLREWLKKRAASALLESEPQTMAVSGGMAIDRRKA